MLSIQCLSICHCVHITHSQVHPDSTGNGYYRSVLIECAHIAIYFTPLLVFLMWPLELTKTNIEKMRPDALKDEDSTSVTSASNNNANQRMAGQPQRGRGGLKLGIVRLGRAAGKVRHICLFLFASLSLLSNERIRIETKIRYDIPGRHYRNIAQWGESFFKQTSVAIVVVFGWNREDTLLWEVWIL